MRKSFFLFSLLISASLFAYSQELTIKEIPDILYLDKSKIENDSLQRLNLVLPEGEENCPILVWIGGGAWSYVNRNMEMDMARQFAQKGIAVASIGHRLSSATWKDPKLVTDIKHPQHVQDLAAAFKWLHDHAEEHGFDNEKMFVGGYSSGAHLAALLSSDKKYLEKHGLSTADIKGAIPIAGTYDVSDYHRAFKEGSRPTWADLHVKAVFGDTEEDFRDASPTTYVDQLSVPMLLISEHNTFNYTQIYEDKLSESEYDDFQVIHVHRLNHAELWKNLSFEENSMYRNMIADFIKGVR